MTDALIQRLKDASEEADRAELRGMLADWRAIKRAFWQGFHGKPLSARKPHDHHTD